jgi:hydroxyacylglutathione hydrolase
MAGHPGSREVDYGTTAAIVSGGNLTELPTGIADMEPLRIELVPMLRDNYAYLIHDEASGATAILDPSEAAPGLEAAEARGWKLSHVLDTHHHNDHCGGNLGLKQATGATVVGPAYDKERIPGIDVPVDEKTGFDFAGHHADVLFIPGHTKGHIAFHFPASKAVFCGDTLFSIGCGRMFEGTPEVMWPSLLKLRALPDDTRIYCGHEYTEANIRFALQADPDNAALRQRAAEVAKLRAAGKPTIPATLGEEKRSNPFLRADQPELMQRFGGADRPPAEIFAALRSAKDRF